MSRYVNIGLTCIAFQQKTVCYDLQSTRGKKMQHFYVLRSRLMYARSYVFESRFLFLFKFMIFLL